MSTFRKAFAATVLPVVALAMSPAIASPTEPTLRTLAVRYGDLDLSSAKDQAMLRARVHHAAVEVCHYFGPQYDDETFMRQVKCMRNALRSANAQVALAIGNVSTTAPRMALDDLTVRH